MLWRVIVLRLVKEEVSSQLLILITGEICLDSGISVKAKPT
jgi:hypothetical protein